MSKICIATNELLKRVEKNRLREELLREPHLASFRATQKEIGLRETENVQEPVLGRDGFGRFAEQLARSGREEVRFQRYLIRQGFYPRIPKDDPLGADL
jgi:hypothetical protein